MVSHLKETKTNVNDHMMEVFCTFDAVTTPPETDGDEKEEEEDDSSEMG